MIDFKDYIKELQSDPIENITEHSKRSALEMLLRQFADQFEKNTNKTRILHEPKRQDDYGSPDFKVFTDSSIIGYVENKKITENLDSILKSAQVKKYRELSENLLLTNYIEFIWIKGDLIQRETLCYQSDLANRKFKPDPINCAKVEKLVSFFFSQPPQQIANPKELALALAVRSKNLKDFLLDELNRQEAGHEQGRLFGLYETFKQNVFHELTLSEFADAFAQMLVYGLFLAKLNADTKIINLSNAKDFIPGSFQLIRELVSFLDELDNEQYRETKWIIDETISIMNNLDLPEIKRLMSFAKRAKDTENFEADPYIYFYETFLSAYDSKLRKAKGVYYTPPQVVNFITRAINDILKNVFEIPQGFAGRNNVTVLDFATGTGTFLLEVVKQILETIPPDSKAKRDLIIKEHILKNIYGFEYLIAPYTIAHLKLSQYLHENGYVFAANKRLQVFLTSTLEPINAQLNFLLPQLSKEGEQAQKVKEKPILVITGNPPYSYVSKNNGAWISAKIKDYYFVDGASINERNPKGLQDDYVKFIRFAQDKMEQAGQGVIGIITNHSFLDNPTFRGMRQSLMNTFDQMYFLDLHGNTKKKEKTPEGGKDENVFDIEQGVAISILIKKTGLEKKVYHADFYGLRSHKYLQCLRNSIESISWENIIPIKPQYNLRPSPNLNLDKEYDKYFLLTKIFRISSSGIKTHRDHFAYDFDRKVLAKRISDFINPEITDEIVLNNFQLKDTRDWKLKQNREELRKIANTEISYQKCQYRPFDNRYIFYHETIIELPRKEIMLNLQEQNVAILSGRAGQVVGGSEWNISFITDKLADVNLFYRGGAVIFPLFILTNGIERAFFGVAEPESFYKSENFTKEFRTFVNAKYSKAYTPEQILGYIYAILHSPTYRSRYAEFLKIDFPRIPFTDSAETFENLSAFGWELVQTHLMNKIPKGVEYKHLGINKGDGDNIVVKPDYKITNTDEGTLHQLYYNPMQYFDNVPEEVYTFHIGGYQVLDKYLKDRKGRLLTIDEIENVENIVKVLTFTIKQMEKIDEATRNWI
jgi:predicted helicase